MSWRDRLLRGSYRGRPFFIREHEAEAGGRRVAVHEYPGRDRPYPEDLGRRTKKFRVDAYLVGDDYDVARDALVAACDLPGAGTLVHPYLGTLDVACTDCSVAERTEEGRMARIRLSFVEGGANRYPQERMDTSAAVTAAAAAARSASESSLAEGWLQ